MKKLLLVALLVAVPALVLAQATTTTTPAKTTEVKKVESTTTTKPEATKPTTTEPARKVEPTATTTKPTEPLRTVALFEDGDLTNGEAVEIVNIDPTVKSVELKLTSKGNVEKVYYKESFTNRKGEKVRVTAKKDPTTGRWNIEKVEAHTVAPTTTK